MRVVGIFGVSGVGKTTLINHVIAQHPHWICVSAGSLIQESQRDIARDALRSLSNEEILKNQEAIVLGIRQKREGVVAELLLLDAHLILDAGIDLFEIPLDVIGRLYLDAIVFVEDVPEHVLERRKADSGRIRANRAASEIAIEQSRARELASSYAKALGIRMAAISPFQADELMRFLEDAG